MSKMSELIQNAIRIAKEAHRGQTRKYGHAHTPYIQHPMRVAARVALWNTNAEETIAAAVLHDVIEDSAMKRERLWAQGIPWPVIYLVSELTNPSKGMKCSRARRKVIDRKHLAGVSYQAKIIKLADRIDNVREAVDDRETPKDWLKLYLKESKLLLGVLKGTNAELEAELAIEIERGKKLCA
jgi:(p)ppGpp synthase/HD superfamily hydrolase